MEKVNIFVNHLHSQDPEIFLWGIGFGRVNSWSDEEISHSKVFFFDDLKQQNEDGEFIVHRIALTDEYHIIFEDYDYELYWSPISYELQTIVVKADQNDLVKLKLSLSQDMFTFGVSK